jgi:hypothetical protein
VPGSPKFEERGNTLRSSSSQQAGITVLAPPRDAGSPRQRAAWHDVLSWPAGRFVAVMECDAVFTAVTISCGILTVILACVALFAF